VSFLNDIPLATVSFIAGCVLAIIGYLSNDLTVFQALAVCGVVGVGAGQLGQARNGAGRGVRR
jgi:hypothetical protein